MHLVNEMTDHFLGNFEVSDNPIAKRADCLDISGGPAQHHLRLVPDSENLLLPLAVKNRHDRRLIQDDTATLDINQRICGTKVNGHVG
jgi:hypothetical protein